MKGEKDKEKKKTSNGMLTTWNAHNMSHELSPNYLSHCLLRLQAHQYRAELKVNQIMPDQCPYGMLVLQAVA